MPAGHPPRHGQGKERGTHQPMGGVEWPGYEAPSRGEVRSSRPLAAAMAVIVQACWRRRGAHAPGSPGAHFLNPHFWHSGGRKGADFTPTLTPTFGFFGARANKCGAHPDEPAKCKRGKRGAKIFDPARGENDEDFSLLLIFPQLAWVGVSALLKIAPCARFSRFF